MQAAVAVCWSVESSEGLSLSAEQQQVREEGRGLLGSWEALDIIFIRHVKGWRWYRKWEFGQTEKPKLERQNHFANI